LTCQDFSFFWIKKDITIGLDSSNIESVHFFAVHCPQLPFSLALQFCIKCSWIFSLVIISISPFGIYNINQIKGFLSILVKKRSSWSSEHFLEQFKLEATIGRSNSQLNWSDFGGLLISIFYIFFVSKVLPNQSIKMSTRALYVNSQLSTLHSQEKTVFASSNSSSSNRLKPDIAMNGASTEVSSFPLTPSQQVIVTLGAGPRWLRWWAPHRIRFTLRR